MWSPLGVSSRLLSWLADHLAKLSVLSFKQIIPLKGSRASGQPSPLKHTYTHKRTLSFTLSCSLSDDSIADLTEPVLITYAECRLLSCGKRVFSLASSLCQNTMCCRMGFVDLSSILRVNRVCAAVHTNAPWCLLWAWP